jgi:hypothetical protein
MLLMMKVCEGNEFWELMLLPRGALMGANASTKLGQDELLWVDDDVDSLKPQYWVAYNE